MDSVTHIVVGAAVGEAFLGRRLGWKAHLLGALAATFPDFDILVNFFTSDEVTKLLAHRSYTHSVIVQLFYAFPLAWLCFLLFKKKISLPYFYAFWYVSLVLHSFMDLGTTYGTQLFLPFTNQLFAFNNIAVVDPLFTLPFLLLPLAFIFCKKENPIRMKCTKIAFGMGIFYLLLCTSFKYIAHQKFEKELVRQNKTYDYLSTSPALFTNLLWSGIAVSKDSIFISEYSVFQQKKELPFVSFPKNYALSKGFEGRALETMNWFSQDKFALEKKNNDTLNFYVAKWGRMSFNEQELSKNFAFHYSLIRTSDGIQLKPVEPEMNKNDLGKFFSDLWNRIFCY